MKIKEFNAKASYSSVTCLEFLQVYDVTEIMHEMDREYKVGYEKLYIQRDVNDVHLFRVAKTDVMTFAQEDENYCGEEYVVEQNLLDYHQGMSVQDVLDSDDFSNWTYKLYDDLQECIDRIENF